MLQLDKLLSDLMKDKKELEVRVVRDIKTQFSKYETQKRGNVITDAVESQIILKMIKQRKESVEAYRAAKRCDLADIECCEINFLETLVWMDVVSEDAINEIVLATIDEIKKDHELSMKDMRVVMEKVKTAYPTAEGKVISDLFRKNL
ncbi:MAG: GatB/YqeY domain-containing protein [Bacteroidales bacterium]